MRNSRRCQARHEYGEALIFRMKFPCIPDIIPGIQTRDIEREKILTPKTDKRFIQANKEAMIAVGLCLAYFIWWYATAYGFGDAPVADYTYVLGLPAWFFYSCMVGFIVFSILSLCMVCLFFREISLEGYINGENGGDDSATDCPPNGEETL